MVGLPQRSSYDRQNGAPLLMVSEAVVTGETGLIRACFQRKGHH